MWDTFSNVWRIAKQLPNSEFARWTQLVANLIIVALAVWAVVVKSWRWLRGGTAKEDDFETPEGA